MDDRIEAIRTKVVGGKRAEVLQEVDAALAEGTDSMTIMNEALIPAMSIVGEKYSSGEFFLPQMMIAARAMSEGLQHLRPHLAQSGYKRKATAIIGTVAGDFHDIGKNILKMMMEGNGYEVIDLGVDVSPDAFVEAIRRENPRFVLLSALITLTMENMRQTIVALENAGVRRNVLVGVGGAPLTQKFAEEIGADFYGKDAHLCIEKCDQLLEASHR